MLCGTKNIPQNILQDYWIWGYNKKTMFVTYLITILMRLRSLREKTHKKPQSTTTFKFYVDHHKQASIFLKSIWYMSIESIIFMN